MKTTTRDQLKKMMDEQQDFALVDVLSPESFKDYHLPGAVNVPIGEGFEEKIQQAVPNKSQPVVVYCKDTECTASPTAAKKMDELGYQEVLDYEAGKVDWKQAGLPTEP